MSDEENIEQSFSKLNVSEKELSMTETQLKESEKVSERDLSITETQLKESEKPLNVSEESSQTPTKEVRETNYPAWASNLQRFYSKGTLKAASVPEKLAEFFREPNNILDSNSPLSPSNRTENDLSVMSSSRLADTDSFTDVTAESKVDNAEDEADTSKLDAVPVVKKALFKEADSSKQPSRNWTFSMPVFFKSVKNRNTTIADVPDTITSKKHLIGKLMLHDGKKYQGLASGIRLARDVFLCTRHSLSFHKLSNLMVAFDIYTTFHEKPDDSKVFAIEQVYGEESQHVYETYNIHWNPEGDIVLLKLKITSLLPSFFTDSGPYVTIKKLEVSDMSVSFPIFHLGYASGSHLKPSAETFLRLDFMASRVRGDDLLHMGCVKSGTNVGIVASIQENKEQNTERVVLSPTKKGGHTSTVEFDQNGRSKKLHQNGSTKEYDMSTLHVAASHIYGGDHLILSLTTRQGSSGGAYFDEDGHLIAVHIGALHESVDQAMGLPQNYHAHVAVLPTEPFTNQFLFDALLPENKSFSLTDNPYQADCFSPGYYLLARKNEFSTNLVTIGVIQQVREPTEGGQPGICKYSCEILRPNLTPLELKFVVNTSTNKLVRIKDVALNTAYCPIDGRPWGEFHILLKDEEATPRENRIHFIPCLMYIPNYQTSSNHFFTSLGKNAFSTHGITEEELLSAIKDLIREKEKEESKVQSRLNGDIFHYTHTWRKDVYASFHYVEKNGHLFVLGIGTHIDRQHTNDRQEGYVFSKDNWVASLCDIYTINKNCKKTKTVITKRLHIVQANKLMVFLTEEGYDAYEKSVQK